MPRNTNEYGFTPPYRGLSVTSTAPYATYQSLRGANRTLTDTSAFSQMESLNAVVSGTAEIATAFQVSGQLLHDRPRADGGGPGPGGRQPPGPFQASIRQGPSNPDRSPPS